ncbi:MAG: hypothetical protein FWC69_06415 [Defluviitaleaceae bacterium]|nr:hypothetical protein [Defluviitaleaceae bacterium]
MKKPSFLANTKVAWAITSVVAVFSLFLGALTTYNRMRRDIEESFMEATLPIINQASLFAFNIQTISAPYLTADEIERIDIPNIVQNIQNADSVDEIFRYYVYLNRAVWYIYDIYPQKGFSDESIGFLYVYHLNFAEQDRRLTLSPYNAEALRFNEALHRGLGFLARPFVSYLPRFD